MKEFSNGLSCKDANSLDLVDYLARLGHTPQKVRGVDYWYLSPLRNERTPSFKVNRRLNVWYDHGEGAGGTLVDFGLRYFACTIPELLVQLFGSFPTIQQLPTFQIGAQEAPEKKLDIHGDRPIQSLSLQRYLHTRKIPISLAQKYLREVVFSLAGKRYLALGFPNRSGGYELRNDWFKGSSTPKDISCCFRGSRELAVFEGFFDFLSFLSIHQKQEVPRLDFLVLNSLSFAPKSLDVLTAYRQVRLYLDNDKAGEKHLRQLLKDCPQAKDERRFYQGYKDLNDWLMHMGKGTRFRQRPPFHSP
ncbi:toprim domain-containing protein [Flaviaesturariibacter amylovorans]|uniref:Toprim domain-containing protein n=1 Tax=Flaviaesturariibacter amylovorans TaxID=1084520 RepID=A0ABP8HLT2_9BACT